MTDGENIELKRFAVKFNPATLIVEYRNSDSNRTIVKKIRFKDTKGKSAEGICSVLVRKNPELQNASKEQLVDLINLILNDSLQHNDKVCGRSVATDTVNSKKDSHDPPQLHYGDLNKAPEHVLEKAKAEMGIGFEANRLTPDDKDYVYDKVVNFGPPVGTSDWDEDD